MSVNYKLVILILALTLDDQVHTGNIFGGHEAKPHSRPYMALLKGHNEDGTTKHCGAFLLRKNFVMTAAHCKAKSYNVLLGVHNARDFTKIQNISVEKEFPHEDYDANNFKNDIMLLKLSCKAQHNENVKPIHLAGCDCSLPKSCSVSGWGRSNRHPNSMTPVLMELNVTLTDAELCPKEKSYCSKGASGPGLGDSGGPLVCEDGKAFGVVSAGSNLDSHGQQIYTYVKIPDYKEWIDSIIDSALQCSFEIA